MRKPRQTAAALRAAADAGAARRRLVASSALVGSVHRVKCYSAAPATGRRPPPPADIPGYARAESFTFLTLPEWYIVYSTDDTPRFIGRAARAVSVPRRCRQYWSAYDARAPRRRREYPFETGYHVMLGVIGASFTAENS